MEISGKIIAILPEFRTEGGKTKHSFVVETVGQYPQKVPFEVWSEDRWSQMSIVEGSMVSVSFDINGREWNGRYFVSLSAWKVVRADGGGSAAPRQEAAPAPSQEDTHKDDLPF